MKRNILSLTGMVSIITMIIIGFSCEKEENNNSLNLNNGTILYMPPPDNCNDYVIKFTDNILYKPSNLSNDFKIDSLLVKLAFDSTDNVHNCGFGGSIRVVDLTHIEKR